MDWLQGMNDVVDYIENNLTERIKYDTLCKIVGCSVYEFSRIFSFMAGMSVSEYVRRRRLSQAVFDIHSRDERLVDIALKYGYESQAAFTRAFKELHGQTPHSARKDGVSLKTYPKITFKLILKGVNELNFRIEKREGFSIIGLKGESTEENGCDVLWRRFMTDYNERLWKNGIRYYRAPFWQIGAYMFGTSECIIGAELGDLTVLEGMDIVAIPAATWAVFTITSASGSAEAGEAYTRIATEWFPSSSFERNKGVPQLEVYPDGDAGSNDYKWEIWMPVMSK